ncbi:hypothetical protein KAX02_06930 [candidate division WOR-3 bacterium]|nr:hypothetical protein [candidate division WOR-3 bacterium]
MRSKIVPIQDPDFVKDFLCDKNISCFSVNIGNSSFYAEVCNGSKIPQTRDSSLAIGVISTAAPGPPWMTATAKGGFPFSNFLFLPELASSLPHFHNLHCHIAFSF